MNSEEEPDEMTPAELKLARHLTLLQDQPEPPVSLAKDIVHTARWQQSVRNPLLALAHLVSATADGLRLLLRGRS